MRANQAEWEAIGIEGRYHWLGKLRDWLLDNTEQDRRHDAGRDRQGPRRRHHRARSTSTDLINFYGTKADEVHRRGDRPPALAAARLEEAARSSTGPTRWSAIISPWNFPLTLALGDAIPALQAGAAVVIKPSEFTPLGLTEVVKAWKEEIGAPRRLRLRAGDRRDRRRPGRPVDFIQFTGSDRTGRKVMARAAETLTPVSLELGGKDPMIVLSDADLDRAANAAAWGGMFNSGQVCISVERIYVEEPAYDEFVAKLTKEVGGLRQGADGRRPDKDVGAMTSPNQTAIVEDHVDDALANGARALTGGKRVEGPGDYFEPTVLVDVDHSMKVMRDETFGPVVGVMKVRDSEEALRLANDTRYGLSGSVFGEKERAERGRPPGRVRRGQRQRRARQLLRDGRADGRLEGVGDRLPPRRVRDQEVLPRRSRSWSPASAASANRPGTPTRRPAAAWSAASPRRSTPATSSAASAYAAEAPARPGAGLR